MSVFPPREEGECTDPATELFDLGQSLAFEEAGEAVAAVETDPACKRVS